MEDISIHNGDICEILEVIGLVTGEDWHGSRHQVAQRHVQNDQDAHDRDPPGGDQEGDHGVPEVEPATAGGALLQGGEEGGRQK